MYSSTHSAGWLLGCRPCLLATGATSLWCTRCRNLHYDAASGGRSKRSLSTQAGLTAKSSAGLGSKSASSNSRQATRAVLLPVPVREAMVFVVGGIERVLGRLLWRFFAWGMLWESYGIRCWMGRMGSCGKPGLLKTSSRSLSTKQPFKQHHCKSTRAHAYPPLSGRRLWCGASQEPRRSPSTK